MKNWIVIFLLLLSFSTLQAQYAINDSDGILNKKEKVSLEQAIGYQLDFYNKVMSDSAIRLRDVKLNIYAEYSAYLIYQKEQTKNTHHRSMGFYSPKNKEAVVCKAKNEKNFLPTCYHELSHFFVNTYFGSVPTWLNEGLAVYFEKVKVGKVVKHEVSRNHVMRVKTMIDINDIDLTDFVSWGYNIFYKRSFSHESYGYALGYSMVQYLMQKEENLVIDLIRKIKEGKTSYEALDVIYEGGFISFEKDFLEYIKKQ